MPAAWPSAKPTRMAPRIPSTPSVMIISSTHGPAAGTVATELDSYYADEFGRSFGAAFGVNASGTAVGYSSTHDGWLAARWDASGTAIRQLKGLTFSAAYAINDSGVAVGFTPTLL